MRTLNYFTFQNDNQFTFDTKEIKPTLGELQIIERVMTRARDNYLVNYPSAVSSRV